MKIKFVKRIPSPTGLTSDIYVYKIPSMKKIKTSKSKPPVIPPKRSHKKKTPAAQAIKESPIIGDLGLIEKMDNMAAIIDLQQRIISKKNELMALFGT
jgi:hypothetical protein